MTRKPALKSAQTTVQGAIREQLDAAIKLWFDEGATIAIQALAYNALRKAHDLASVSKRGQPSHFFTYVLNLPTCRERKKAMLHIAFAKHGDRDMKDVKAIDDRPDLVEHDIFDAVTCYFSLFSDLTFRMDLFAAKYFLDHPELFIPSELLPPFVKLLIETEGSGIARLGRKEFRDKVSILLSKWRADLPA